MVTDGSSRDLLGQRTTGTFTAETKGATCTEVVRWPISIDWLWERLWPFIRERQVFRFRGYFGLLSCYFLVLLLGNDGSIAARPASYHLDPVVPTKTELSSCVLYFIDMSLDRLSECGIPV